jgi:hypothetical protein
MKSLSRLVKSFFLATISFFLSTKLTFAAEWSDCMVTQLDEAGNAVKDAAGNDIRVPTLLCLEVVFEKILNVAVELAVVVLFIFLVIGGFKFITSGGDPKATESAKNTLTYAILGLVLLIGIWLILNFIQYFTGIQVTVFKIGI